MTWHPHPKFLGPPPGMAAIATIHWVGHGVGDTLGWGGGHLGVGTPWGRDTLGYDLGPGGGGFPCP